MTAHEKYLGDMLHFGHEAAVRALGASQAQDLATAARKHFNGLEQSAPQYHDMLNVQAFMLAVPLLALYRALRQDLQLDEPSALKIAEDMLRAEYHHLAGLIRAATLNAVYGLKPLRTLFLKGFTTTNEPDGYRAIVPDGEDAEMALDVLQCPLVNYARKQGAPEIVPMICRLDFDDAELLWGHELHRTGTLATGAERCDFRYVATKKT